MTLLETQRCLGAAITAIPSKNRQPLEVASRIIKPSDRLTSVERLEIYVRSYWARLFDSLKEDFPGVLAIIGDRKFEKLACAYLSDHPSHSFTLRDLGSKLIVWLAMHPAHLGKRRQLAIEMARLEWAHIIAFDGPETQALDSRDLETSIGPRLKVGVQPYVTLLTLRYPVDELRVALQKSRRPNVDYGSTSRTKQRLFVAVHRLDSRVFYRRLHPLEFGILQRLQAGQSLGRSIQAALEEFGNAPQDLPALIQSWFATWSQFGWLTVWTKPRVVQKGEQCL